MKVDQKKKLQELETKLISLEGDPGTDPQEKFNLMNELAWEIRSLDLNRAHHLCQQVQKWLEDHSDTEQQAICYTTLAEIFMRKADYQQSIIFGHEALKLAKNLNLKDLQPFILSSLGGANRYLGNLPEASNYFQQQHRLAQQLGDKGNEVESLNNMALIYDDSGDLISAYKMYSQALKFYERLKNIKGQALVLNNMAFCLLKKGDHSEALPIILKAVELIPDVGDQSFELSILDTTGVTYLELNDYPQALTYFQKTFDLADKLDLIGKKAIALLNMGRTYAQQQQNNTALSYLHQALSLYEAIKEKRELYHCYHLLAEIYEQQGDLVRALHYFKLFNTIKEEVFNNDADQKLKNLQVVHETETAKREAEVHRLKNIELEQEIAKRRQAQIETQQRADEMTILAEVSREISGSLELSSLLKQIATRAATLLHASSTAVFLKGGDSNLYEPIVVLGHDSNEIKAYVVTSGQGIIGHIAKSGVAEIINDTNKDARSVHIPNTKPVDENNKIMMGVPLIAKEAVIGLIVLWRHAKYKSFTASDLEFLKGLSQQAVIAIENAKLFKEVDMAKESAMEAQRTAEMANQAKSLFLANMSHELRTPLNAILGFAQIMVRSKSLTPEHKDNLAVIHRSGEYLLSLINSVLELSKIEAGHIKLNEKDIDVYHLLDDLENLFSLKALEKNINLSVKRPDNIPRYIRTDEVKLRQVLINLIGNAIKFTQEGSVIIQVVNAANVEDKKALHSQNINLEFMITDTGPGIASDEISQLFDAFSQTQTGRVAQEGTGLGLTISREFAHLMGGEIKVESEVNSGSTFTFNIRCEVIDTVVPNRLSNASKVVAVDSGQPGYRILVVDDNSDNRQLLIKLLSPVGFSLQEAQNGQEAIQIWEHWKPHLIWMDKRMPVVDGYKATKQIRSLETQQLRSQINSQSGQTEIRTKIIGITASSFEQEREEVLSVGCDDFLRKPFREDEIFEMLHKHLGVRFVYDETAQDPNESNIHWDILTPEVLTSLPKNLYQDLKEAIEFVDVEKAVEVITMIQRQNEPLAVALKELVNQFRFDKLQTLFKDISTDLTNELD